MSTNPLTAAALGLKLGLLLCLFVGCEQPAPEPADDTCVEDGATAAPEKSVVVVESQADEWNRFAASYPYLAADWQRMKGTTGIITIDDIAGGQDDLRADIKNLKSDLADAQHEIRELKNKPDCCVMPPPSAFPTDLPPVTPEPLHIHHKSAPISNLIDAAEQRSIDDGQRLIIVLTKDGCPRCASVMSNTITHSFFKAIDGSLHFQEVNTTRHPEAAFRFGIPVGTLLPVALLWNPDKESFHEIQIYPGQPTGDFLSELNLAPEEAVAPPRKRLRNLLP